MAAGEMLDRSVPFEDVDLLAGDAALRAGLEPEGAAWALERVRKAAWTGQRSWPVRSSSTEAAGRARRLPGA
jgi:hypothetical protein